MSYILEALKKSEQERHLGDVPRLDSAQSMAVRGAPRTWWPWLIGGVLLLNAGAMLWLAVKPAAVPVEQQKGPVGASDTSASDAILSAIPSSLQSAVSPVDQDTAAPESARSVPAEPPPAASNDPAAGPVTPVSAAPAPAPAAKVTYQSASASQYADVPHWDALTTAQKSRLIRPALDVHVYAKLPARRFVLIDLQKYREGERLASGGKLLAITSDGIVVEQDGIRYRVGRP